MATKSVPHQATRKVRGLVVVARKSSPVPSATVAKLEARNKLLLKFFVPRLTSDSFIECTSLVFNGFSSNYNMKDSRKNEISVLKRKIEEYDAEAQACENCAYIIISGDDGLFTNVDGIHGFFARYVNITLTLVIYLGENRYDTYNMRDLLQAISEIKSLVVKPHDPCHTLVRSWIGIAVGKELIAQVNRDLKRALPQKRNNSAIYLDDEAPPSRQGKAVLKTSERRSVVQKYGILVTDNGSRLCPHKGCSAGESDLEKLRDHILDHCRQAGRCVLCPDHVSNPFNSQSFVLPSGRERPGYTKPQREHVERHLPPTFHCEEEGCSKSFHTLADYLQHQEGHERSQMVTCSQCHQSIRKTYMKTHLHAHCPSRDKENDSLIECNLCHAQFSKVDMFYKHMRAAHQRREEIITTAMTSGLFSAGLPGLGLDVSAAIEESVKLSQAHKADAESSGLLPAQEHGRSKVNGKSVGEAVRFVR